MEPMADNNEVFLGEPSTMPDDLRPPGSGQIKRARFGGKKLLILLAIVVAVVLSLGAWKVFGQKSNTKNNSNPTSQPVPTQANQTNDLPETSETKTYKGDHPRIELTYPANWTVVSQQDNGVRIESPEFTYTTIDKGDVTGTFRVYVRQGARPTDGKYIGQGQAVEPSEKLTYSAPAVGQRPETNLSHFGLNSTDSFAFFLIAGNFELKAGDSLGPDYGKEPDTYIVAGGYSSKDLVDDLATNQIPLESYKQSNAYKQAIEIIKSLKLL